MLAGNDGPTLGITSSLDMFNKLKYESRLLDNDLQNTYNAFNFIVTAWHLFNDWPKCEDKLNISRIKRQKNKSQSWLHIWPPRLTYATAANILL